MTLILEQIIGELLLKHHKTLAVAESCTGGLLAHRITNIPGASSYFLGGVVAYSNEAKEKLLGVKYKTLERYGAVSKEVVGEMLNGVMERLGSDIALAVSGIAGPGGGTVEKPVGTVWLGYASYKGRVLWKETIKSNRLEFNEKVVDLLLQKLREESEGV